MDVAYISALSALGGSVVGGLTTGITSWVSARAQAQVGRRAAERGRHQELFRDFIIAASRLYTSALLNSEPKVEDLVDLYSMISRMRVTCSPEIVACADKIMVTTIDTFFAPNKTLRDLEELIKSGLGIDPLKAFSETARKELRALE